MYTCAKTCKNRSRFDEVIREIIWCSFFCPSEIYSRFCWVQHTR